MSWLGRWLGGGGGGLIDAPVISNIYPAEDIDPGGSNSFSVDYSEARYTPIEFDLTNLAPGADVMISIKFENRDETYTALDTSEANPAFRWKWPFDASSSISNLAEEPIHVVILPRDGWPPTPFTMTVGAIRRAVES